VFWHPDAILRPEAGDRRGLWSQKYPVHEKPQRPEVTIAMPRVKGDQIVVYTFFTER